MDQSTNQAMTFCFDCSHYHVKNPSMKMFNDDLPPRISKQPFEVFGLQVLSPAMDGFNRISPRTPDQICENLVQSFIFKYFCPTHKYKTTGNVDRIIPFNSTPALMRKEYLPLWEAGQEYLVHHVFEEVEYTSRKGTGVAHNVSGFVINKQKRNALIAIDYFVRVAEWAFLNAPNLTHYPWNPAPEPRPTFEYNKDGVEAIENPTPIKIESCMETMDDSMNITTFSFEKKNDDIESNIASIDPSNDQTITTNTTDKVSPTLPQYSSSSMSNPIGNDNHTYTRSSSAPSDIREKGTGNGNGNIIQNKKNSGICEQSYSMGYEQGKMKALEVVATALREIDEEHERHKHKMYDIICRLSNQLNNL